MNKNSILLSGLLLSGLAIGLVETDVIPFNTWGIHAQGLSFLSKLNSL